MPVRATKKPAKSTKSARVDVARLRRVRKFLKAGSDSEAIELALEEVDERRRFHELIDELGGVLRPEDWEDYGRP